MSGPPTETRWTIGPWAALSHGTSCDAGEVGDHRLVGTGSDQQEWNDCEDRVAHGGLSMEE